MFRIENPINNHSESNRSINNPKGKTTLAVWLFGLSLLIYLLTRLIRLPEFPIYFFTDEAIQTQHAADLIANGFRSPDGVLLPTYFENGGQYNLSLSVYVQVLPVWVFGKSIWVTRGVSVLCSLAAAAFTGLILKQIFQNRNWWLGSLLLTATPAWFLHSRTAFETVLMASLYAGFLFFYLRYRQDNPKFLFPALVLGALAFYTYSPGQVIMVFTGILLLIFDWRYHRRHPKIAALGLGLLIVLTLPYLRFVFSHQTETLHHLMVLNSYWVKPLPVHKKVGLYFARYLKGFNPLYWFFPNPPTPEWLFPNAHLPAWLFSNQFDLARHTMRGYGHIAIFTLPFWIIRLIQCIRKFQGSAHRALLLATLAAPSGAAIVDWGITRGLVFIIPTVLITSLGMEQTTLWLQSHYQKFQHSKVALVLFFSLSVFTFWMTADALINGPTWYTVYGLAGMQYGGKQVFTRAAEIARSDPETTVLVSSTWANAPDVLLRYFGDDLPNLRMGNINAYGMSHQPLERDLLFIMTKEDLVYINESGKFTQISIEETLSYPDGSTGFYFIRLAYVDNIKEILDNERTARQALQSETLTINNLPVRVQYPMLDINEIDQVFDGDPTTLVRTLEANPMQLTLTFPEPVGFNAIRARIGGTPTRITLYGFRQSENVVTLSDEVGSASTTREITLSAMGIIKVDKLVIEIYNPHDGEIAHVHLWEIGIE